MLQYDMLRDLGVWLPREERNKEGALKFWGFVFGWNGVAQNQKERIQRLGEVETLLDSLCYSPVPTSRIYLAGGYYRLNKEKCFRFFRAIQDLVEKSELTWFVVTHQSGHKGYWWGKQTPQEIAKPEPGGGDIPI